MRLQRFGRIEVAKPKRKSSKRLRHELAQTKQERDIRKTSIAFLVKDSS
jgi:hypothetical protein